jgi:hypothetical protein
VRNSRADRGLGEARSGPPGSPTADVQRLRLGIVLLACLLLAGGSDQAGRALAQPDCRSVAIRSPFSGDVLRGTVEILGSSRIDAFQFYKLEWAPESEPESWRAVSSTIDQPVSNGRLDLWDTQPLPDGRYRLKLTVVDQQSGERCRALVAPLWLANDATPEATEGATPLPTITAIPRQRPAGPGAGSGAANLSDAEPTGTAEPDVMLTPEASTAIDDPSLAEGAASGAQSGSAEDATTDSPEESRDTAGENETANAQGESSEASEPADSPGPVVAGGEALAEAGGNLLVSASMGFAAVMLALLGLGLVWWLVGRRGP